MSQQHTYQAVVHSQYNAAHFVNEQGARLLDARGFTAEVKQADFDAFCARLEAAGHVVANRASVQWHQ